MRVLLASLTVLTAATLAACGGGSDAQEPSAAASSAEPAAEPPTMTVFGELALMDGVEEILGADGWSTPDKRCTGGGGYSDIAEGAQVTVYDAAGEALALGELGTGHYGGGSMVPCTFAFRVAGVSTESDIFSVEVSQRGKVNFSADEAEFVVLTLGE